VDDRGEEKVVDEQREGFKILFFPHHRKERIFVLVIFS